MTHPHAAILLADLVDLPTPRTVAPWLGMPVGLNDCTGAPIHFGDVLLFDEDEWGGPDAFFCAEYVAGQASGFGTPGDWPQFCTIVRKWDAGEAR